MSNPQPFPVLVLHSRFVATLAKTYDSFPLSFLTRNTRKRKESKKIVFDIE